MTWNDDNPNAKPWCQEKPNDRVPRDGKWRLWAEGYDEDDRPYAMYIMRRDMKTWGDITLKVVKPSEKFRVRLDVSINGKHVKEVYESDSHAQADLVAESWLDQYTINATQQTLGGFI